MFAETIILVEGPTEFFTLPIYLKRVGYSLAEHGTEIINCRGKAAIPLYWRLFKAYGYNCYVIFDCDKDAKGTQKTFNKIFTNVNWKTEDDICEINDDYAYFGRDFETYLGEVIDNYFAMEQELSDKYQITSKPGKAKAIAQHIEEIPNFIKEIANKLEVMEMIGQN